MAFGEIYISKFDEGYNCKMHAWFQLGSNDDGGPAYFYREPVDYLPWVEIAPIVLLVIFMTPLIGMIIVTPSFRKHHWHQSKKVKLFGCNNKIHDIAKSKYYKVTSVTVLCVMLP